MIGHNRLGRELGLSRSDPLVGAGLRIWLPADAAARYAVEEYLLIFRSRGRSYRELPLRIAEPAASTGPSAPACSAGAGSGRSTATTRTSSARRSS